MRKLIVYYVSNPLVMALTLHLHPITSIISLNLILGLCHCSRNRRNLFSLLEKGWISCSNVPSLFFLFSFVQVSSFYLLLREIYRHLRYLNNFFIIFNKLVRCEKIRKRKRIDNFIFISFHYISNLISKQLCKINTYVAKKVFSNFQNPWFSNIHQFLNVEYCGFFFILWHKFFFNYPVSDNVFYILVICLSIGGSYTL